MHAPLIKQIAAIIYDLFLVIALFFVVGIIVASIFTFAVNNGHAITDEHPVYYIQQFFLLSTLAACTFIFYGWFWTHGGQTLGMKTWKIKLVSDDQQAITWKQASIRFLSAGISLTCIGFGYARSLWHENNRTWHDELSKSHLILMP